MLPTPSEKIWLVHHESVGKLATYSDSNSSHGIIWPIFTQRLSADNLHPLVSSKSKGWRGASSAFLYTIAGGYARVLTYFTCLSCTLLSIARSNNLLPRQVRSIIQQALIMADLFYCYLTVENQWL